MNKKVSYIITLLILCAFPIFATETAEQTTEPTTEQTTEQPTTPEATEFIVCIDPGHQQKGDSKTEPIAPGSSHQKARVSSGTEGVGTKKAEYVVNLEASLILKELLEKEGFKVVMTRETHDVNISNAERAQVSNNCKANMTIRLHCDSISNSGKTGATILVPSDTSKYTKEIYPESQKYGELLKTALEAKNVKVNGIFKRDDMTGFNWSQVPAVILEMGFMSNWNEDQMLSNPDYQRKLMEAVVESLKQYQTQ
ncbi:MAG: N-acetylmuramoyl-L-alanine amidase [Epulopiscium sp. Nele67-Bin004]|nr:MAG: N-acetylmuramoyl-L-alanine amidase [Epulopiscium sp. Nele67-Bin004]